MHIPSPQLNIITQTSYVPTPTSMNNRSFELPKTDNFQPKPNNIVPIFQTPNVPISTYTSFTPVSTSIPSRNEINKF